MATSKSVKPLDRGARIAKTAVRTANAAARSTEAVISEMIHANSNKIAKLDKAEFDLPSKAAAIKPPAPLGMNADVTSELATGAIAFGDVLKSIGHAVVLSQAALDEAAIESAKKLSATKVDVAISVTQPLDDDGKIVSSLPPTVQTQSLSLSNFIMPTLHQWQYVTVSMDMTVSEIDATAGMKVKSSSAGAGFSASAGGYSASAAFGYGSVDAESRFRADFAEGTVRFDALLGPREEFRYPETNDYAVGPTITVGQAPLTSGTGPNVTILRGSRLNISLSPIDKDAAMTPKTLKIVYPADLKRRLVSVVTEISTPAKLVNVLPVPAVLDLEIKPSFNNDPPQTFRVKVVYGQLVKDVDVYI